MEKNLKKNICIYILYILQFKKKESQSQFKKKESTYLDSYSNERSWLSNKTVTIIHIKYRYTNFMTLCFNYFVCLTSSVNYQF